MGQRPWGEVQYAQNQPLTRENMADTMEELKNRIEEFLETYQMLDSENYLNKRYKSFRNL
mgnify:CR=1 FL=1